MNHLTSSSLLLELWSFCRQSVDQAMVDDAHAESAEVSLSNGDSFLDIADIALEPVI